MKVRPGQMCILLAAGFFLTLASCSNKTGYLAFSGYAQGGVYTIKINLVGEEGKKISTRPEDIKKSVDSLLSDIDRTFSGYNKLSLLSRLNAGESIVPNDMFCDLYNKAYKIWVETGGAVDCGAGELFNIWGFGFTTGNLPGPHAIEACLDAGGMKYLKADIEEAIGQDGSLAPSDLPDANHKVLPILNFNSIAQGYSADVVAGYLRRLGIRDMLVDIGEIYCEGSNPSGLAWTVGIDRPEDGNDKPGENIAVTLHASGACGIVTSGNYRKYYTDGDGNKISHTIDPRNGRPAENSLLSATIMADTATQADAYATYCMVVGLEEAIATIEASDMKACLIYDDKGEMKVWSNWE